MIQQQSPHSSNPIRFSVLAGLIAGLALSRLVPHPPNFTPVMALALFGGARFERTRWAFVVPLAAMLASDLVLELVSGNGFHAAMPVVYLCFVAIVALGLWLRHADSLRAVGAAAFGASLFFFVVTNGAIWLGGGLYPRTVEGLLACYVAALPFFANTLAATVLYSLTLFGAWSWAERRWPRLALAPQVGGRG